ncbi:autotransporter outer membrane beta-barrel domain-containing protein [Luteibacter aegosomaticola]|uniref:autotransporter family protein n=1 Tax=Luteibacter aegosomaticola TaxID=2911538 RepID=UPI001FF9B362|nr:autotransporter outer membrane beta-barrel domain-containing protein [Luteibacter aegosomaticola]UPG92094.1 autotransporter outer membrane beta-barrel domain-containing protein [Luteibacter aegosomaticola]
MHASRPARVRRARLCQAIAVALVFQASAVAARTLQPGQNYTVVQGDPVEAWVARGGGSLTLMPGASTLNIALTTSTLTATNATIASSGAGTSDMALSVANGSSATLQGGVIRSENGTGLAIIGIGGSEGSDQAATATLNGTAVSGGYQGAIVSNGGYLTAVGASIAGTGANSRGLLVNTGTAELTGGTHVSGVVNGAVLLGDARGGDVDDPGRHLIVDGSIVQGGTGAAVLVQYGLPAWANGTVSVVNGGQLVGGNGVAIQVQNRMHADIDIATSSVVGDIVGAGNATANLTLGDKASLRGAVNGAGIDTGIDATARWETTGASSIGGLRLDGALAFAPAAGFTTVNVAGDLSGQGGNITFNTRMNEGGAIAAQATDRLLVHGNVTTTGTTLVSVTSTGDGALTDLNRNGVVDNNEGISLIQVAGNSRADAFALAGSYVAAGPYQYTLHAFGPGEVDAAQSQLGAGSGFQWDYRLGNRYVTDCSDDCAPPVTPEDPERPPVDRAAVVPQLPAYMLAPMALQNYGSALNDGLHQRMGEIRDSAYGADVGGEVFARVVGSQLNYTRNLSFQRYGYDFDQQINALQVGAGIVAVDTDHGSIRAGWALDHGTTRVTPSAADGNSYAKYYANGGAAWVTYEHGSGLWVDGIIGVTRYHGDVSTDLRGDEVGKVHAQGWTMSVEVGKPLPLGGDWTVEPQFQFRVQQLNFRDFRDKDGLDIRLGNSVQATSRLGIQVGRTANPLFAPYGRLDFIHTSNGNPTLQASSEAWNAGDTFQTGSTGNSYRVAAGVTSQLTDHVQLYGEGTWRHYVGSYGLKGWSGNAGIRITF